MKKYKANLLINIKYTNENETNESKTHVLEIGGFAKNKNHFILQVGELTIEELVFSFSHLEKFKNIIKNIYKIEKLNIYNVKEDK